MLTTAEMPCPTNSEVTSSKYGKFKIGANQSGTTKLGTNVIKGMTIQLPRPRF